MQGERATGCNGNKEQMVKLEQRCNSKIKSISTLQLEGNYTQIIHMESKRLTDNCFELYSFTLRRQPLNVL